MPATRKISREAQNQDLEQMKGLFGSPSPVVKHENPIETVQPIVETPVSPVVEAEKVTPKPVEQIQTVALNTETPDSSRTTTDTTVGIRMTMQKKREIKAYFIQKGTTLSQGILDAYNLLKELDAEGIISYKDGQLIRNK
ncbi:MAG: hypothetical protein IKP71_05110 [Candidatus Riflebacteria bacterium]|nr:hypothetical protein [Candidatus Riflebacteria bacterium]